MTKQKGETNDILFCDRKLFGDEEEHFYEGKFYDGIALLKRGKHEHGDTPEKLILLYPTMDFIKKDTEKVDKIRAYCGLDDSEKIYYHDIALAFGEIMNTKINLGSYLMN